MAASSSAGKKLQISIFKGDHKLCLWTKTHQTFHQNFPSTTKTFIDIARLPCCDPSAQGTRGTCRGQPPTFANATLCIFCRSPSLRHRCWKGPRTGLEVFEQSARKVLIKISSHKGCHSGLKITAAAECWQLCSNLANFHQTHLTDHIVSRPIVLSSLSSWNLLLVHKGCRCCCCKGSLRPTRLVWIQATGMGGAQDYGLLTCSREERLKVQVGRLWRLSFQALEALSTWGRACYVKRTQAGCSMYVVADLGNT